MKLELGGISKSFGGHRVLNSISWVLDSAKSLALIGPSGGGKTTLLRILAGLEYPDAGTVSINDQPLIFREQELERHRRKIGIVFQALNLFPHLSALENILLPLEKVHRRPTAEARGIAMDLLKRFHLEAHAHKRPAALSGGQKQRVAIVRAIAIKPRILLFDEPTSALDPEMTSEVLEMIEELKCEGRDFILVTHQMGFARRVAEQVAFLADGRLMEFGSAKQVFDASQTPLCRDFLAKILKY